MPNVHRRSLFIDGSKFSLYVCTRCARSQYKQEKPAKAQKAIGETDELGLHAVKDRLHVHDLHATILYLMGLDHTKLIYRHQGRPERLTGVAGRSHAIPGVLA